MSQSGAARAGPVAEATPSVISSSAANDSVGFSIVFLVPTPSQYLWSFGDGTSSTAVAPSHSYASPGTYAAGLKVSYAANDSSMPPYPAWNATYNLTVLVVSNSSAAPVGVILWSRHTISEACGPTWPVALVAEVAGGSPPYSYSWSFGDGMSANGSGAVSHAYATPNGYYVTMTVVDSSLSSSSSSIVVPGLPEPGAGVVQCPSTASFPFVITAGVVVLVFMGAGGVTVWWVKRGRLRETRPAEPPSQPRVGPL